MNMKKAPFMIVSFLFIILIFSGCKNNNEDNVKRFREINSNGFERYLDIGIGGQVQLYDSDQKFSGSLEANEDGSFVINIPDSAMSTICVKYANSKDIIVLTGGYSEDYIAYYVRMDSETCKMIDWNNPELFLKDLSDVITNNENEDEFSLQNEISEKPNNSITVDSFSEKTILEMKKVAEDNMANDKSFEYDEKFVDMEYLGNYFFTAKDKENTEAEYKFMLIYKNHVYNVMDKDLYYYWFCLFDDIKMDENGTVTVDYSKYFTPRNKYHTPSGHYYYLGYETLEDFINDVISEESLNYSYETTVADSDESNKTADYIKVYREILYKCISGELEYYNDFDYMFFSEVEPELKWFMLKDLNDDGIPELLLNISYSEDKPTSFNGGVNVYNSLGKYVGRIYAFDDMKLLATELNGGDYAGDINILEFNGNDFEIIYYLEYECCDDEITYNIKTNYSGKDEIFEAKDTDNDWVVRSIVSNYGFRETGIEGNIYNITQENILDILK